MKLNRSKAHGSDGIPGWVLKENADMLAAPIADILNLSYHEGRLPPSWKEGDVVPVPKQRPVQDINKHLRPISLTPILSKIAEEYVVDTYVKPAVLSKIDPQQFGTVPKSSTTHALISMIHSWAKSTDGNGSTTRVVLFDFRKAFDLIDHHVLARKLSSYDIPRSISCWIIDFLMDRKQRIKWSRDCFSEWEDVLAGVPQGTKLGPWLFLVMITGSSVDHITVNDKQIGVVLSAKLLGVVVSDKLRWNVHVEFIRIYRIYLPISRTIFSEIWTCIDQKHSHKGVRLIAESLINFCPLSGVENLWKCHANSVIGL